MAEGRRMTGRETLIGVGVLLVVFVLVFLISGSLSLPIPQWLLSGIAALIGVAIWFAIINRRKT